MLLLVVGDVVLVLLVPMSTTFSHWAPALDSRSSAARTVAPAVRFDVLPSCGWFWSNPPRDQWPCQPPQLPPLVVELPVELDELCEAGGGTTMILVSGVTRPLTVVPLVRAIVSMPVVGSNDWMVPAGVGAVGLVLVLDPLDLPKFRTWT